MDYTKPPASYTPTNSPQPTFGQSGETVRAVQAGLNQRYANDPSYTPLKEDGLYGPLTQQAYNRTLGNNQTVVTSGPARYQSAVDTSELDRTLAGVRASQNGAA